jgi:hypothetical protein
VIRWRNGRAVSRAGGAPTARAPDHARAAARVPLPIHIDVPKVPCWACPDSEKWPIRFQTDLDVLAPLGDGPANAALWLKDFARPQGARLAEAEAATKRRVEGPPASASSCLLTIRS